MAVSVVDIVTGGRTDAGVVNLTPPPGADAYVAVVSHYALSFSPPPGWDVIASADYHGVVLKAAAGASWSTNPDVPVSVAIIGYSGNDLTVSDVAVSDDSTTSPSVSAPAGALVVRAVADTNDSFDAIGYPASATLGRGQLVQPDVTTQWAASVAVAHAEHAGGETGTASWLVPEPYVPAAFTLYVTEADVPPVQVGGRNVVGLQIGGRNVVSIQHG